MDNEREDQNIYEVLGQTVRLKKDEMLDGVLPSDVVGLVQTEIGHLLKKTPGLNESQTAVLVALKLASDKLLLEKEYRENVHFFKTSALSALSYFDQTPH